jgi:hypothetical protein
MSAAKANKNQAKRIAGTPLKDKSSDDIPKMILLLPLLPTPLKMYSSKSKLPFLSRRSIPPILLRQTIHLPPLPMAVDPQHM